MRLRFHAACAVLLAGLPAAAQLRDPAALVQVASLLQPGTSVSVNVAPTGANNLNRPEDAYHAKPPRPQRSFRKVLLAGVAAWREQIEGMIRKQRV